MSVMAGLGSLITSGSIVHNTNNNDMEKDDTYCLRWTRHPDMLVGEVAACVEKISSEEVKETLAAETDCKKSENLSKTGKASTGKYLPGLPGKDLTARLGDGSTLRLHSAVLAAASPYFRTLGQGLIGGTGVELVLPDNSKDDLDAVVNFLYTGQVTIQADRMEAVASLALSLGLPTLVSAVSRILCKPKQQQQPKQPSPQSSPRRRSTSPGRRSTSPSPPPSPPVSPPSLKRPASPQQEMPPQRPRLAPNTMLQSILQQAALVNRGDLPSEPSLFLPTTHSNPHTSQLATILTAAAKLKQVAEQAMQGSPPQPEPASSESAGRKLAFHEPRPCPTCQRMYRDAATLRTHTAIMHSEGPEPFRCSCGISFGTKYEMYQHKKAGHPPLSA